MSVWERSLQSGRGRVGEVVGPGPSGFRSCGDLRCFPGEE